MNTDSEPLLSGSGSDQYQPGVAVDDGTLAYVSGGPAWISHLVWVDRSGASQTIAAPPHAYQKLAVSPSGRHIALEVSEATSDIYLFDFGRGGLMPMLQLVLSAEAYAYHQEYVTKPPELFHAETLKRIRAGAEVGTTS